MPTDVDRVEKAAAAAPHEDGIMELFAAAMFAVIGLFWIAESGWIITVLALPLVIVAAAALRRVKRWLSEPRIGYVEGRRPEASPWGGVALIGAGVVLMVAMVTLFGGISDPASWRRWAPLLAGFLCSGGFWYLAASSDLWRHRALAAASIVWGVAVAVTSDGSTYRPVATYAFAMAVLLLVVGLALLVRFLGSHPRLAQRGA